MPDLVDTQPLEPELAEARLLALALSERLGRLPLARLVRAFGTLRRAVAQPRALEGWLTPAQIALIEEAPGRDEVRAERERAGLVDTTILAEGDPRYPPLLAEAPGHPPVLYVRGRIAALDERPTVAIVGTRRATGYGLTQAESLAAALASAGATVTSGLAMGIDARAHRGALAGARARLLVGGTVAVLASSVDRITPRLNLDLGLAILDAGGAITSEIPFGMPTHRASFPRRNRIIAGLSLGVIVIEAGERSGALSTAAAALEQNRHVMVLPGRVDSPASAGSLALLVEGATPIRHATDVQAALGLGGHVDTESASSAPAGGLLALLEEPHTATELAEAADQGVDRILAELTQLELTGLVRRDGFLWRRAL